MSIIIRFRNLTLITALTAVLTLLPIGATVAQSTPILTVTPDTLRFYADFCGGFPAQGDTLVRNFMVANTGGGSMNWTGTAGESWVDFHPMQGGNYDSVMTWIDWSQTPVIFIPPFPGDTMLFETQITIEAPGAENSPQVVIVQLGYTCEPDSFILIAQPSYFELTLPPEDTLARWFNVVEAHNGNIEFYFTNSSNWLILPQYFAPLFTPDSVPFMVSSFGLDPGVYFDTIVVLPAEEPANIVTIPIRLTVTGSDCMLATTPGSFNFTVPMGQPILGESLYVYEISGQSIDFWTYNEAYWLYVDTMAASPLYTPRLLLVDIYADTLLEPGIYTDTIFIYSDGCSDSLLLVPVSLIIEGESPEYVVETNPGYFDMHLPPDHSLNTPLSVYEIHGHSVGFVAAVASPWIQIAGGPVFTTPATLDVNINTTGLEFGFYADTIFIYTDTDYISFQPVAVPVYIQVQSANAVVRTSPDFFHFTVAPGDSILNAGMFIYEESGDSMPYAVQLVGQSDWIYFPFGPGNQITPDSLYFSIFTDGLSPGTYGDSIVIFYPYDDIYGYDDVLVPVVLTIEGDPPDHRITTMPTSFSFTLEEGGFAFDSLFVYEVFDQQVGFHYWNSSPWLVVNPLGMPPYVTPTLMTVVANASGLSTGMYIDTISIYPDTDSYSFQPVAVPVILTVSGVYLRGDANGDEQLDVGDAVYLINYIFRYGPAPDPLDSADANCDGIVDIGDVVRIVAYTFRDGPAPGCQ